MNYLGKAYTEPDIVYFRILTLDIIDSIAKCIFAIYKKTNKRKENILETQLMHKQKRNTVIFKLI